MKYSICILEDVGDTQLVTEVVSADSKYDIDEYWEAATLNIAAVVLKYGDKKTHELLSAISHVQDIRTKNLILIETHRTHRP